MQKFPLRKSMEQFVFTTFLLIWHGRGGGLGLIDYSNDDGV